ncbi:MAG: N-acetylgalactosamine-6-sulfatase [Planctomycetota bacterium]|nr:MAG: N-acetylgalactosamine-6-sulfatase [Planctomycetota bacterium]
MPFTIRTPFTIQDNGRRSSDGLWLRRLATLVLLLIAFSGSFATELPADERPNFVIILADDMGYADLACFGAQGIRTPRLDRMAQEGMRFTSFYAQPICGPSRAALMTGCYPMRVAEVDNIKNEHPILHTREITIAEVLRERGYVSAAFGKWDLATHSQRNFLTELLPTRQGFNYFFGTPTSNDFIVDLYRNEERIEERADMNLLTQRYTDEVLAFIEENRERPFFVYLPHTMPHTELGASEEFRGQSERGLYGDVIEEIDHSAGRILDKLRELKLERKTYVLFTSDNGPWLIKNKGRKDGSLPTDQGGSAGPLRSGKVSTWEGGVRVPTIFWAPGRIEPGTECDEIATTMDMLPTLAALAGAAAPQDRQIDGEDISHLLRGEFDKATPDKTYYYYLRTHLQAVRQGKWKLHLPRPAERPWLGGFAPNHNIEPVDDVTLDEPLLIDLEANLAETEDVASEHPDVVARLLQVAEAARADVGDYNRIGRGQRFFDEGPRRPRGQEWIEGK